MLGGIGYTWEHDAHLLPEAGHGDAPPPRRRLRRRARPWPTAVVAGDAPRTLRVDLPPEAEPVRERIAAVRRPSSRADRRPSGRGVLADAGYLVPHWPRPWGLDADPIEQLVIDQELAAAHVRRAHLQVAGWVLPTIIDHGTAEQQERWVRPSLRGEIRWCQMFSEPDAGSDLAASPPRPPRVDGGWSITGRRCGPRWPTRPTGRSAWPAPIPTRRATRASGASSST